MTFTLPATTRIVAHAESCRKRLHAPRLSYVLLVLDNRRGSAELDSPEAGGVAVVTKSGRRVSFEGLDNRMTDDNWLGRAGHNIALYNECPVLLHNTVQKGAYALPGERTSYLMAARGVLRPADVRYFFVTDPDTYEFVRLNPV